MVNQERRKGEQDTMKKREIKFTDYAPIDKDYTREELAEIYKKIITDIASEKQS